MAPQLNYRILLVEDDLVDVKFFKHSSKLNRINNEIRVARDGLDALEILTTEDEQNRISKPYIIILDLNMPRMDGHEFLRHLRNDKKLKDAVVFIFTTSDNHYDLSEAYDMNIAGYFLKSGQPSDVSYSDPKCQDSSEPKLR